MFEKSDPISLHLPFSRLETSWFLQPERTADEWPGSPPSWVPHTISLETRVTVKLLRFVTWALNPDNVPKITEIL